MYHFFLIVKDFAAVECQVLAVVPGSKGTSNNLPIIATLPECKAVGVKFYIVRSLVECKVNLQPLLSGKQMRVARIVLHFILVSTCDGGAHAHAVGSLLHQRQPTLHAAFFYGWFTGHNDALVLVSPNISIKGTGGGRFYA